LQFEFLQFAYNRSHMKNAMVHSVEWTPCANLHF